MTAHLYNTTPYAGFIDPAFLFADGKTLGEIERGRSLLFGVGAAERHRLVEAAKSPTRERSDEIAKLVWLAEQNARANRVETHPQPAPLAHHAEGPASALRDRGNAVEQLDKFREQYSNEVGTKTVIQFREWSREWRIRTQVETTVGSHPPEQIGIRESAILTDRGARKIADACAFMAATRGGFKTFVTGTFDESTRGDIASGNTTIQQEVTRTMDALSKMYRRGWLRKDGTEVAGHEAALAYCWVVEVPKNEAGEDNPHVHMLIDWLVPYGDFREWSARIESIWGNGYFHLEKIDDPLCAGAYMAKAASYLTKAAGQSDQGTVRGNRYAISKNARAPAWATLGTYQLGIMGTLIREVHDSITAKHAAIFAERKRLRDERDRVRQLAKAAQEKHHEKRYPLAAKHRLEKIGAALVAVRAKINAIPVRASKYQLVIKTAEHFERFLAWAEAHGWGWNARPDSHGHRRMIERIRTYKRRRLAWPLDQLADFIDRQRERFADALQAYNNWENWGAP